VLNDAIAATEAGSPHRAGRLNNLAHALQLRFDCGGGPDDRDHVTEAFRASCAEGLTTDVEAVLAAADNWQQWAAQRRAWRETGEACDAGLRAAALLHRTQLLRDHQLAWLQDADGLAAAAALARSHTGDLPGAVTALEGGARYCLLMRCGATGSSWPGWPNGRPGSPPGTPPQPRRSPAQTARCCGEVFAHGQPVLCEMALPSASQQRQTHAVTEPGIEAVRAARQELDAVIEEIRGVEGFEQFLAPPTFDDIHRTAGPSPLVYFAAADQGGLALVVRDGDVRHVPLEELSAEKLRSRVEAHLDAYTAYRRDGDAGQQSWSESLSEVTRWLWTNAVGPVLDVLTDVPEAVFVAGGLLGLLPLHAAWTEDPSTLTGRRYALDQLTISYAPNARALQAARDLAETVSGNRLLAVVEPAPVDAPPLPFARWEARGFAAGAGLNAIELSDVQATPLRFRDHAPESEVLHLACHGWANLTDPLSSGLLLAGRPVVLGELMEMQLRVRLAVLSACETALPGTELPDEVIGLPTGLLQAGVAGVVASQWAVLDQASAMLMTEFARRWAAGKLPPGVALRQAQQWLRDTTNTQKRAHWLAALHEEPRVPADVVEEFVEATSFVEPDDRDHEDPTAWAAFAHLGA